MDLLTPESINKTSKLVYPNQWKYISEIEVRTSGFYRKLLSKANLSDKKMRQVAVIST
jgi:hypothetical protein